MAKKPTIGDLVEKNMPLIRDAFLAAISEITSKARIADIVRALERGDVQGAIDALYIDRAAFRVFENTIADAFQSGGVATINGLPLIREANGSRLVIRFDARNPRAEQWLKEHSSEFVTRIIDDQKQAIRQKLTTGMTQGDSPRSTALDIVGRINKTTGQREGGLIGLSSTQEAALNNAKRELQEGRYNDFMRRVRRDKRFDRTLAKAGREGRVLTVDEINKMTTRYSNSLLKLRGETIARTEALQSLHEAQDQAIRQLVDTGKVSASQIRRVWDATGDKRTRFDHAVADGQSVGLDEQFNIGGRFMAYVGDPNGGPENTINCRCYCKIKFNFVP